MKFRSLTGFNYLAALSITGACTLIAIPFYPHFDAVNIIALYLLGTTVGALRFGRGPSLLLSVANVLAFDYFFVPPRFSLDVADTQYLFTMAAMLFVASVIAHLTANSARHRDLAHMRERRTAVLYAMSKELAVSSHAPAMIEAAVRHITGVFNSEVVILIADKDGQLTPMIGGSAADLRLSDQLDLNYARKIVASGQRCTKDVIYQPLRSSERVEGLIALLPRSRRGPLVNEQLDLLDAFAVQLALALHRAQMVEAAEAARICEERAILRNTLLASISHDLRTPLAAIAGAGSLIAQQDYALNLDRRTTLGRLIERKAHDMVQQLTKILELMRMEQGRGKVPLCADWHTIEELIVHSLKINEARLSAWRIEMSLARDLPLVLVEPTLIVQILCNLLENAVKYTPPGTTITISAGAGDTGLCLVVADDGPGLPAGDPEQLFEKFQRGRSEGTESGVGLGLAICRAAARMHGGDILAMANHPRGARFEIRLPVATQAEELSPLEPEVLRAQA